MGINVTRTIRYIRKGDKGDRGPVLRGPQAWSDCADNYGFQSGAEQEQWKDVVLYQGEYYSCVKSHIKTADNFPGSAADTSNKFWQLGDKIELVATKILLASYALVKNLGVEYVDMRDDQGNIIFQAKDGKVICNSGVFANVSVVGDVRASNMSYRLNEIGGEDADHPADSTFNSVFRNIAALSLHGISEGTSKTITILNEDYEANSNRALTLYCDENVFARIGIADSPVSEKAVFPAYGPGSGKILKLIGYRATHSQYTYWRVVEQPINLLVDSSSSGSGGVGSGGVVVVPINPPVLPAD